MFANLEIRAVSGKQSLHPDQVECFFAVDRPLRPHIILELFLGRTGLEIFACIMLHRLPVGTFALDNLPAQLHGLIAEARVLQYIRPLEPVQHRLLSAVEELLRLDEATDFYIDVGLESAVEDILLLFSLMLAVLLMLVTKHIL